jgi:hypothetical protein
MEIHQPETRYRDQVASASLTAANTYTAPLRVLGEANIWISGTWAGTITLQATHDDGATWIDVPFANYTANTVDMVYEPEVGVAYRLGFKAGAYTSGTAVVRISQ